jgi:hypothetical protein
MRRIAAIVLLTLGAGLVAPLQAQAQEPTPFTYDLAGGGALTLRRDGQGLVLTGRVAGEDVALRSEGNTGGEWRFVLPGTPGLAGALSGRRGAPRVLIVRRAPGDTLEGRIESEGQAAIPLRGTRRVEPAAECKPKTDRWWSRHAVGAWGFARALWDFYKPGSKRFEELRGDATRADTRGLRTRLERLPAPWSPELIYQEARAMTSSNRAALELAFGLVVDDFDLPLAPLPGIPADEVLFDKYAHYFGSAILAHRSNASGSFTIGVLKEVMDQLTDGTYSEDDLMADALGAELGQRLQCE